MKTKSFFALMLGLLLMSVTLADLAAQSHMVVNMSDGTKYFYEVALVDSISFEDYHEYVDLGLSSGTLWATCNVGANSPEDYGDYFAWGETMPKSDYSWDNLKYCTSFNVSTWTGTFSKYTGSDEKTVLDASDDAATANWGVNWRMPTKDELYELFTECVHVWTTQGGMNGRLFTGPNGNTLFLPAAGYHSGNSLSAADDGCFYWSSSLYTDSPNDAYYVFFNSFFEGYGDDSFRFHGQSVRPVVNR